MAQIDTDLYRTIADAYALIDVALSGVTANARTAVDAIVDVDTTTYPDATPSISDADAALEIELALLTPFNSAYVQAQTISLNVANIIGAVISVNKHVIANGSGVDDKAKLDNWINAQMLGEWTDEFCPQGWANLSEDAGYNVDDWSTSV